MRFSSTKIYAILHYLGCFCISLWSGNKSFIIKQKDAAPDFLYFGIMCHCLFSCICMQFVCLNNKDHFVSIYFLFWCLRGSAALYANASLIQIQWATDVFQVCWIISQSPCTAPTHDDVIKWKHIPRYWPFVWRIHRWPVNSPHKGQWRGALIFSLICA